MKNRSEKTCSICKKSSVQDATVSLPFPCTDSDADLDGRPAGANRTAYLQTLEECPHCGYAAPDISQAPAGLEEVIAGDAYRALLAAGPKSRMQRAGFLYEYSKKYPEAAKQYLHLAWMCDDAGEEEEACRFRGRAIDALLASVDQLPDPAADNLIVVLADLFRRCGEFETAGDLCDNAAVADDSQFRRILIYERLCAECGDAACHTVREADAFYEQGKGIHCDLPEMILRVDGMVYAAGANAHGRGWSWNPEERKLTLSGYQGSAIEVAGDLTLVLEDDTENAVSGGHDACLRVQEGDLLISGRGGLLLFGADTGIRVESGALTIACSSLTVSETKTGIRANGQILIKDNALVSADAAQTGLCSTTGGLHVLGGVLTVHATQYGVYLADSSSIEGGMVQADCVWGPAVRVRHGMLRMSGGGLRIAGRDTGVQIDEGGLLISGGVMEVSAETGVRVSGSLEMHGGILFADGSETGCVTGGDFRLHDGEMKFFGSTALQVDGSFRMHMGSFTATGDAFGVVLDGVCTISGGQFHAAGQTGVKVRNTCVWDGGIISVSGVQAGIQIAGKCTISRNSVSVYAEEGVAMRVCRGDLLFSPDGSGCRFSASGKEGGLFVDAGNMEIVSGSCEMSGRTAVMVGGNFRVTTGRQIFSGQEKGLVVAGDVSLSHGITEVTGEEGCVIQGSAVVDRMILQVTGEQTGIRVRQDISFVSSALTLKGGKEGVCSESGSIVFDGGAVSIVCLMTEPEGRSCGVAARKGDVVIRQGIVRVSGESCSVEAGPESGRVAVSGGLVRLTSPVCGVAARILDVSGGLVTMYGKRQGAVVMPEGGEICLGDRAVVSAGKSERLITAPVYSPGMRYLQVRFEKGTGATR